MLYRMCYSPRERFIAARFDPLIVAAVLPLLLVGGWVLLYLGLVATTRRR